MKNSVSKNCGNLFSGKVRACISVLKVITEAAKGW